LEPLDIYTQRAFYEQINQTTSIQFIHWTNQQSNGSSIQPLNVSANYKIRKSN
jgi:hypothetical protein